MTEELKNISLTQAIWIFIKDNPNVDINFFQEFILVSCNTTVNTVKTLLSIMLRSGVIVKSVNNENKVLNICPLFTDSKQVSIYVNYFHKHEAHKENKDLSSYFLEEELDQINALRMKIFVKTGDYLTFDQLFMYLLKYHNKGIKEKSDIKFVPILPDYITKDPSITLIEKPNAMDKLLNFFKNMKFSYP